MHLIEIEGSYFDDRCYCGYTGNLMWIYTTNENKTYMRNMKIKAVNWVSMTKAREKTTLGPAFCQRNNEEKSSLLSNWTVFTLQRFLEPFHLIWTTAITLMMLARRIAVTLMMPTRRLTMTLMTLAGSQVMESSELVPTLSRPGLNSYEDIINPLKKLLCCLLGKPC